MPVAFHYIPLLTAFEVWLQHAYLLQAHLNAGFCSCPQPTFPVLFLTSAGFHNWRLLSLKKPLVSHVPRIPHYVVRNGRKNVTGQLCLGLQNKVAAFIFEALQALNDS